MAAGMRFEPTTTRPDRVVHRPRLAKQLLARFDHRLTTIVGSAGFGKSTALALAAAENRLDPMGRDVWLSATPLDADPTHFLVGLAQALDADPQGTADAILGQICETVWAEAPTDVVLIVDDAHHLASAGARSVVEQLIEHLPSNGRVLLAARVPLKIRIARLRALGQVLELDERDLNFDDDELAELRERRRAETQSNVDLAGELPRHAATADLQLAAGSAASIDFLWEEILGTLSSDRLTHLKRCSVLDVLDDDIVADVTDGTFTTTTLTQRLPLVEEHDHGVVMHALLRDALVSRQSRAEHMKALMIAGDAERNRGRHDAAIGHYLAAGDESSVAIEARKFLLLPMLKQPKDAVLAVTRIMKQIAPNSAVTTALVASGWFARPDDEGAEGFRRCAEIARASNDAELEAFALHRCLQISWLAASREIGGPLDRLAELRADAPDGSFVHVAFAHAESTVLQESGDSEGAFAALDGYRHIDADTALVMRSQRLCDLGRPEMVGADLSPADLASVPAGAEIFLSLAMWLRGDADSELAAVVVADMIPAVTKRGFAPTTLSILSVGTSIALAAGDFDAARRWAEHAAEIAGPGHAELIVLMSTVANAALAAVTESDEAAAAMLSVEAGATEIHAWPSRPYLLSLPLVYLVRPESRPVLDHCDFGPSLSIAVSAGQALAGIREATTPEAAADARAAAARLPWNNERLLRVHVLPHHLVELACAASGAGSTAAIEIIERLPMASDSLRRVAKHHDAVVAATATELLSDLPSAPTHLIETDVFGTLSLTRDGRPVDDADWARRARVRELWALLLERRRVHRSDVLELMWSGHSDEVKAAANLRSTLSTLQRVVEPDRDGSDEPFFITNDRDHLVLSSAVISRADQFDRLIAQAQADDRSGLPGRALDRYRRAVDIYGGDYLDEIDASWAVLTRLRLRSAAVSAACRVAELTAAKGEPEQAAAMARRAQEIDPLSERAGRALISAFDAAGDRSAARDTYLHLVAVLATHDLEPEIATRRLGDRLLNGAT